MGQLLEQGETTCPLCFGAAGVIRYGHGNHIDCPRCAEFFVDASFLAAGLPKLSPREKAILSIVAKRFVVSEQATPLFIDFGNYRQLIDGYVQPDVTTRRKLVLREMARRSRDVGDIVPMPTEYPAFECTSQDALNWIVESLREAGDLRPSPSSEGFILTAAGWDTVGPLRVAAGTCFIAMPFRPDTEAAHAAIERAVRSLQLVPLRVDKVEHNGNINDFILAEIRRAEVVIAEFSHHNAGVYFEAGFALGLGREVIYLCRKDHFDGTHFDTKAYNHIIWDEEAELEARLVARLRNTVPSVIARDTPRST